MSSLYSQYISKICVTHFVQKQELLKLLAEALNTEIDHITDLPLFS